MNLNHLFKCVFELEILIVTHRNMFHIERARHAVATLMIKHEDLLQVNL